MTYQEILSYLDAYVARLPMNKREKHKDKIENVIKLRKDQRIFDPDVFAADIRDAVKNANNGKDKLIGIFRGFTDFLAGHNVIVPISYPPIPLSDAFERQMYILKYFQKKGRTMSSLQDVLWVSSRTLEEDLQVLRNYGDEPVRLLQQEITVPLLRDDGEIGFESTAHPILLVPNLTQVMIQLEGLRAMCENPLYKGYAHALAENIWSQLTDYAKDRLRYVVTNVLHQSDSWYADLSDAAQPLFRDERDPSFLHGEIMNHFKMQRPFFIYLHGAEGSQKIGPCMLVDYSTEKQAISVKIEEMDYFFYLSDIDHIEDVNQQANCD